MAAFVSVQLLILVLAVHLIMTKGHGRALDLSNRRLNYIPNVQDSDYERIDLSRNSIAKITRLELSHFKLLRLLDLSWNKIQNIDTDVFYGLHKLTEINLSFNPLDLSYNGLPKGVFRDQQNSLRILKLTSITYVQEWAVETLENLNVVEELHLNLAPTYNHFPSALANLPNLRLLNLQCRWNNMSIPMTHNWILPLKNSSVEELSFHRCDISSYEYGVFANFRHLQALSLACTENHDIHFDNITNALSYLGTTPLNTLFLDKATRKKTILKNHHFCNDIGEKVTNLSFRRNGIGFVEINAFKCLKRAKSLAVGFDPFIPLMNSSFLRNKFKDIFPHTLESFEASYLLTVGLSDQFRSVYCAGQLFTAHDHFQKNTIEVDGLPFIPSPNPNNAGIDIFYVNYSLYFPTLKHIDIDNIPLFSRFDRIIVAEPPFRIERGNASKFGPSTGIFPLFICYGLPYLQTVDLSGSFVADPKFNLSFLETLDPYPEYPSLKVLNISGNELSSFSQFFPKLFRNMPSLEELDMSQNGLYKLTFNTFAGLENLKILCISHNLLTMDFLTEAQGFQVLDHLGLSYNRISTVQKVFTDVLDKLASVHQMTFDISHNPLVCQCSTLDFITWLQTTNVTIIENDMLTCDFVTESLNISFNTPYVKDIQVTEIYNNCHVTRFDITLLTSVTVIPITFIFATILLLIKCKLRIKVLFYRLRVHRQQNIPDDTVEYHIYILYSEKCDNDRRLVVDFLRPLLEQEGYRLFFNGKDDIPGHDSYEEIYRGIRACQKVIVVVSPHLLQNGMCDFALQVTIEELHQQCICLLMYSDLDKAQIRHQPLKSLVYSKYITCIDINPNEPEKLARDRLKYFASEGQTMQCFG